MCVRFPFPKKKTQTREVVSLWDVVRVLKERFPSNETYIFFPRPILSLLCTLIARVLKNTSKPFSDNKSIPPFRPLGRLTLCKPSLGIPNLCRLTLGKSILGKPNLYKPISCKHTTQQDKYLRIEVFRVGQGR